MGNDLAGPCRLRRATWALYLFALLIGYLMGGPILEWALLAPYAAGLLASTLFAVYRGLTLDYGDFRIVLGETEVAKLVRESEEGALTRSSWTDPAVPGVRDGDCWHGDPDRSTARVTGGLARGAGGRRGTS